MRTVTLRIPSPWIGCLLYTRSRVPTADMALKDRHSSASWNPAACLCGSVHEHVVEDGHALVPQEWFPRRAVILHSVPPTRYDSYPMIIASISSPGFQLALE